MKALMCRAFGPIGGLAVEDVGEPVAGPGQVLIEVHAAAVNFPDALIVQGLYQVKPPLPFSPGAEMSGVIRALGPGVAGLQPGDRVIASAPYGGMAQSCVVEASRVIPLLPGMDFDLGAALVLTYSTSLHALKDCAHLRAGETLLVLGAAGGVGLAAIEIGKAMGARVIAAASSDEKLALCTRLGADETINYSRENLKERALALTDGRGVDVVYDPVGGELSEAAMRSLAWRGRLLVIGFAAGPIPKIPLNLALLKERSIVGVYWGESVKKDPSEQRDNLRQLGAWFAAGQIRPVVTEKVPLEQAADAIARIASRQVMGKVVVQPQGSGA